MTTSPLKVEGSRAQFEAWFKDRYDQISMPPADRSILFTNQWASWQASRACMVVTLPEKSFIPESDKLYPDLADWPNGYNSGIDESANTIRAAGITVKGDS